MFFLQKKILVLRFIDELTRKYGHGKIIHVLSTMSLWSLGQLEPMLKTALQYTVMMTDFFAHIAIILKQVKSRALHVCTIFWFITS